MYESNKINVDILFIQQKEYNILYTVEVYKYIHKYRTHRIPLALS